MVQVTSVLLAIIIMLILLFASIVILSGAVPSFQKAIESIITAVFPKHV